MFVGKVLSGEGRVKGRSERNMSSSKAMAMAMAASPKLLSRPSAAALPLSNTSKDPSSLEKYPVQALNTSGANTPKKKKRHSPFRIRVGCLVALRYRPRGNSLKRIGPSGEVLSVDRESYSEVWTDPLPGRDEGLALIGRRVRCCFPKSVLSEGDRPASSRIIEGEIVSLIDYENQWLLQKERRRRREPFYTTVELLVDRNVLKELPFLERTDEDVDTSNMSATEKKRLHFEELIRGMNNVTVKVNLGDSSRISCGKEDGTCLVAKWVIRKRVKLPELKPADSTVPSDNQNQSGTEMTPETGTGDAKTQRKKKRDNRDSQALTLFLGDGNDPQGQQVQNWRWLAGRYDDLMLSTGEYTACPEDLSFGLVGEVLSVVATEATNGVPATLATVTLRRMFLPEHCVSGRLSHHGPLEFFDDADACRVGNGIDSASSYAFQVQVEELVIISRKFDRRYGATSSTNGGQIIGNCLSCPIIMQSYSFRSDSYRSLEPLGSSAHEKSIENMSAFDVCHRCHKMQDKGVMERLKSSSEEQNDGKITCQDCQKVLRSSAKASAQCDCRACSSCGDSLQEALFKFHVERAFDDLHRERSEDKDSGRPPFGICIVCGSTLESRSKSCEITMHAECAKWDERLGWGKTNGSREGVSEVALMSTANGLPRIHCHSCCNGNSRALEENNFGNETIASAYTALQVIRCCDFDLPSTFMDYKSLPVPSEKPVTLSKPRRDRGSGKKTPRKSSGSGKTKKEQSQPEEVPPVREVQVDQEENSIFVPSCSRLIPYEPSRKHFSVVPKQQTQMDDDSASNPVNEGQAATIKPTSQKRKREPDRVERKSTSRAARANQRRMMKGIAAFGIGLDALAGREQQLRFDRSSIHAWGVFADEGINAGDMIVEYRGELIGNAVAEMREKEYEKANIGSDYMFRIDAFLVCDATKQGNVARFINASCDPNCYTQIITLNGSKRIAIYAKRDIQAGEELCYDYKFPFEFDESKRVKCHCGAQECRGFMNWVCCSVPTYVIFFARCSKFSPVYSSMLQDKRYVALQDNQLGDAKPV